MILEIRGRKELLDLPEKREMKDSLGFLGCKVSPEQTARKERKERLDSEWVLLGREAIQEKTASQELKATRVAGDLWDLPDPRGQEGNPEIQELME